MVTDCTLACQACEMFLEVSDRAAVKDKMQIT
jgi:hypothetical protein